MFTDLLPQEKDILDGKNLELKLASSFAETVKCDEDGRLALIKGPLYVAGVTASWLGAEF